MKVELCAITGKSPDSHPCLVLTIDSYNYLIGAPEELPRLVVKGLRITKINNIFMTTLLPYQMGGIVPTLIQFFKYDCEDVKMTTPDNVDMCLFMNDRKNIDTSKFAKRDYKDENITAVPINMTETVSYDINIRDADGIFDAKKAKELSIPVGPLFSQLKAGKTVTLDDGRVIEPHQVVGPPIKVGRILVLDVHNVEKDLEILSKNFDDLSVFNYCIHITEERILNTDKYLSFFEKSGIQHNICFLNRNEPIFDRSFTFYNNLQNQFPEIISELPISEEKQLLSGKTFINMSHNSVFNIYPKKKLPKKEVLSNKSATDYNFKPVESFSLTTLGSGCKYPTNWRNTSCHLLQTPDGFVLLDCGAGSIGQLRRKFGYKGTEYILQNLFCIWISHRHSDHTFGLAELLFERIKVTQRRIPLMCPYLISYGIKRREPFYGDDIWKIDIVPREDLFVYGSTQIRSCLVQHIEESMACEVTVCDKYKFVYSGDRNATPREMEKEFGTCDLLLHEATFAEEDYDVGSGEGHSTFKMAIESGKMMNAKYTLLCHISQRYNLNDLIFEDPNVLVMLDYLTINYDTIENDFKHIKEASDNYAKSLPPERD